jgi:hypothetical protein
MKTQLSKSIACSLLSFRDNYYLLPTVAIARAAIFTEEAGLERASLCLGYYQWADQKHPILTLDLLPLQQTKLIHTKIAVLHGPPSFAVLFEGQARRLNITLENIAWADEMKKTAIVSYKKEHINVILVDLKQLCEQALLFVDGGQDTQISK